MRERDGRLTITARATEAIREAVKAGKRFMSCRVPERRGKNDGRGRA